MLNFCTVVVLLVSGSPGQGSEAVNALVSKANAAIKAGDHGKAYEILKRVHTLEPDVPKLRPTLEWLAVTMAVEHTQRRRHRRAIALLQDAVRWQPSSTSAWYHLGLVHNRLLDHKRALPPLERAVELGPEHFEAQRLLGITLFELGRNKQAAERLRVAKRLRPNDRAVTIYLAQAAGDKQLDQFEKRTSSHFVIQFDAENEKLKRLIPTVIKFLESTHIEFTKALQGGPRQPISVVFYSETQFSRLKHITDWARGYFDGKMRVPLDSWMTKQRLVKQTIRHELGHAFVAGLAPGSSTWVHEGIAQWLEGESARNGRARLRGTRLFSVSRIRRPFHTETDLALVLRLYAQSLAMVNHLARTKGKSHVSTFLHSFQEAKGTPAAREDEAMSRVYGKPVQGLLDDFAARYHLAKPAK